MSDPVELPPITVRPPSLTRRPAVPAQPGAGPSRSDGYPDSNARGQYLAYAAPASASRARAAAAEARAAIAAARQGLARAGAVAIGDLADDWNPSGWVIDAGDAVVAAYLLVKLYQAEKALAKAEADENVEVEGEKPCPKPLVITFELNGYDKAEFDHQLQMQQNKIMQKGACKDYDDIDKFDNKSQSQRDADRRAATKVQKQVRQTWMDQHPGQSADNLAALHRLDMVAGGDPLDIAEMGDSGVNSSIGPQWNAVGRKPALKEYAKEICDSKGRCPFSVTLIAQ